MLKFTKLIRFVIKKYFCITEPFLLKDIAANFFTSLAMSRLNEKEHFIKNYLNALAFQT